MMTELARQNSSYARLLSNRPFFLLWIGQLVSQSGDYVFAVVFVRLTIGTELRTQLVTAIKVRRGPANDNRDFEPVVRRAHRIKPINQAWDSDKAYDSEGNHELLRE